MVQEIGESREAWGRDVWAMAEDFANSMKSEVKPFYIVYSCKEDKGASERLGRAAFRQTIKAYYHRPEPMLGILTWFVNNPEGRFDFMPDLSAPFDIPLDPSLLSDKESDSFESVSEKGKQLNVLVS